MRNKLTELNGAWQAGQDGQTLIETLVALFILVMGVTAAVGLAIYAFGSSTNVTKQVIATGLAREGVEAIRNMRDTNWMRDALSADCYNLTVIPPVSQNARCYKNWLNPTSGINFNLQPPGDEKTYALSFDPSSGLFWQNNVGNKWGLDFVSDASAMNFAGYYVPNTTSAHGSSEYYRKITLTYDADTVPYNYIQGLLKVKSQVWWTDKKCPRHEDWIDDGKCSVQIETSLTNWKNY
jgi:type II secretory pathway pseudopilin PulG